MGWYGARLLRWRRMKESPVGRRLASDAAAGSSTDAADAMGRTDSLAGGSRVSPARWLEAAGDAVRMRNRAEQSINEAPPPSFGTTVGVAEGEVRPFCLDHVRRPGFAGVLRFVRGTEHVT
jgi:hypothetical protein